MSYPVEVWLDGVPGPFTFRFKTEAGATGVRDRILERLNDDHRAFNEARGAMVWIDDYGQTVILSLISILAIRTPGAAPL